MSNQIQIQVEERNWIDRLRNLGEAGIQNALVVLKEYDIREDGEKWGKNPAIIYQEILKNKDWKRLEYYENALKEQNKKLEQVKYAELRKKEYPSWESVIEALIDEKAGNSELISAIIKKRQEVKAKYPKPIQIKLGD